MNVLAETKLAIQDKTQVFLAERSQYIVFHAFAKNKFMVVAYLCQD